LSIYVVNLHDRCKFLMIFKLLCFYVRFIKFNYSSIFISILHIQQTVSPLPSSHMPHPTFQSSFFNLRSLFGLFFQFLFSFNLFFYSFISVRCHCYNTIPNFWLYVVQVHFAAPLGLNISPSKHPSFVSPQQSSLLSCKISLSFSVRFFFFNGGWWLNSGVAG